MSNLSFKDYKLSTEIADALSGLEYDLPTEVQSQVIPLALERKDLIVKAQTGSGKTASYGIPICEMVDWLENKPQALILTPTRELAVQVKEDITNLGKFKRIKATALFGRAPIGPQKTELKQKNHVVVGTPGRVMDHIERGNLNLTQIKYLIIDEADKMLNMGFIDQVEVILKELPEDRVTMLFSATMPDAIRRLSLNYMKDPVTVDINDADTTSLQIEHLLYRVSEEEKESLLGDITITENPDCCIIFCKTKDSVDTVCRHMERLGYSCDKIHGGMEQDDRLKAMKNFKRGRYRYLIATDVAARGIDVDNINLVINYDLPFDKESYVHRTGRTGRAGQSGKAITLAAPAENRRLKEIEEFIGFSIPERVRPTKEEVQQARAAFKEKMMEIPEMKKQKSDQLNKEIMRLRFTGGKKKKLRATNFVGVIANLPGVSAEDIGIITVMDSLTFVEILNGKGSAVMKAMKNTTVCGKLLKVSKVDMQ
ncbi:MAG: DEAD/DEAH box helicase [Mobilitalea sp.]